MAVESQPKRAAFTTGVLLCLAVLAWLLSYVFPGDITSYFQKEKHAENATFQGAVHLQSLQAAWGKGYAPCSDEACLANAIIQSIEEIYLYNDITLDPTRMGLPPVKGTVTIYGACQSRRCKIDGQGAVRPFEVALGGSLLLMDLEITNGFASVDAGSDGGAVLVRSGEGATGGRLRTENVAFYRNKAVGNGGAVMVEAGALARFLQNTFF